LILFVCLKKKSDFSLGSKEEIILKVVQKLRSLMESRFQKLVCNVSNKYSLVKANTEDELIDISMEVLDTSDP
jgi:ribosomal protein L29